MNIQRSLRKIWGLLTVFTYTVTSSAWALPAVGLEVMPRRETPAFLSIDIPSDLAQVEEIYEAPPQVDPRLILHIQNAHGNYEAQLKIKKLLQHLYDSYGFRLFFVEGAVQKLNPDYLKIFPDNKHNVDVADYLAREGKLTGAEYYLVDAPADVQAVGIEQSELYRANYEVFKEVYARQEDSNRFVDAVDARLMNVGSREFSQDLRQLVGEWKKFETGHRAFMPFLDRLAQDAKKHLGVDMGDLVSQVEWPQITRLLILQNMEKELDLSAGRKERDQVVAFLRNHQVSEKVVTAVQGLEERHIRMNRLEPSDERLENLPRYLLERLAEEAGPKGFNFTDYPNFSLYAGYFVLKSEIDSKALFDEIEQLFDKLLDTLAKTQKEKVLLGLLRDNLTLRKFFHLELTRESWDEFLTHQERFKAEAMIQRVGRLDSSSQPLEVTAAVQEAFQYALNFYTLARQRDSVFYYMIKQGMHKESEAKSALLTGGFHTAGVFQRFRQDEVNYGVLMPRLQDEITNQSYVDSMLGNTPTMFKTATLEIEASLQAGQNLLDERRVVLTHLDAAIQTDQKLVVRGTNPETDYYSAERFTRVINESPFAKLRQVEIRLNADATHAYVFFHGEPVRTPDNKFLIIPTVVMNDAEEKPVRVFATSVSVTDTAPPAYTESPDQNRKVIVPPAAETISAANLQDILNRLAAEAAPVPVPGSRQDQLRNETVRNLRDAISKNADGGKKVSETPLGADFLSLLNGLDLKDELARTEGKPQERAILLSLVSALVAFGSVDAGIGENTALVLDRIVNLLEGRKTNVEKIIDAVRTSAPQFVDEGEGEVVTVTDKFLTPQGVENLAAQLVLNPNLRMFFVFTPPEGQAADETAFVEAAKSLVTDVEGVLNKAKLDIPNLRNRLAVQVAARNERAIETRIRNFYDKKIAEAARIRKSGTAEESERGVFVIFMENGLSKVFSQTNLPATIIKSENLSALNEYSRQADKFEAAQKFVAGKAAQHLYNVDTNLEIKAALLRETDNQLRNVTYNIQPQNLGAIGQLVERLTAAFEAAVQTLRAA